MKLKFFKRDDQKKSETKKIRREGNIPAVIYLQGNETANITIGGSEFSSIIRDVLPGRLSTTIFTLVDEGGKTHKAVLKEIQYAPTTYQVQHLDFEELLDDVKVNIKVPIEFTGVADCVGVKLGGVLRQVIRHLKLQCLPKDIPTAFQLDVRTLALGQSKRLSDLEIPPTVRPLVDMREVAVVIAKR